MIEARIFWFADRIVDLAALGVGVATILAVFAGRFWLAELCTHFRVQYLGVLLLVVIGAALRGRYPMLALAAVLTLVNGWQAGAYLLPWLMPRADEPGDAGQRVSLISLNLWNDNREFERVRVYLAAAAPDVLVLAELTPQWSRELGTVLSQFPHRIAQPRESPWGLGVYSKFPLAESRLEDLGVEDSVNVHARIAIPGQVIELFAVHVASPAASARAATRNLQLRNLAALLEAGRVHQPASRMVMGDLNVTPFSPYFRELLRRTGMEDARRRQGWHGTWPVWFAPAQIPIDFCITDPGLTVLNVVRGPEVGSDHYPLEVQLRIGG